MAGRAASSRARSSSSVGRRKPTASRWRMRCFCPTMRSSIRSQSLKSSPTMLSAVTVRPRATSIRHFYLRARGIPEAEARSLLIAAFVGEALDKIDNEALRAALDEELAAWLADDPTMLDPARPNARRHRPAATMG